MNILVSVINYNSLEKTQEYINSICTSRVENYYEFIFLDNSEVYQLEGIQLPCDVSPKITISFSRALTNYGFAKGHNYVLRTLKRTLDAYDLVIISNNDIKFDLEELDGVLEYYSERYDLFSPSIFTEEGNNWFLGGVINYVTGDLVFSKKPIEGSCDFISGCFMLIKPDLYERLGGFDERFFMYAEDLMLSLKAKKENARLGVMPLKITHSVGSGYSGNYSELYLYENTRNRLVCLRELKLGVYPISLLYFLLKYGFARFFQLFLNNPKKSFVQIRMVYRGFLDGFRCK